MKFETMVQNQFLMLKNFKIPILFILHLINVKYILFLQGS